MTHLNRVGEIDLLIADPPYITPEGETYVDEISTWLGKVRSTGQAYVFLSGDPREVAAYLNMETWGMDLVQILVWNYNNTGQRQPDYRYNLNYQLVFYYRGKESPALNKPSDGTHQYACQTVNAPDGRIGDRYHQWQKPIELIERFIRNSSEEGQLVFDPFAGTGTTMLAAAKLGRIAHGCEVDVSAVKIAEQRGCDWFTVGDE